MKAYIFFALALILAYMFQAPLVQERGGQGCPVISITPSESVSTGSKLAYKANVQSGNSLVTPTFVWTVLGGKIVAGQGTSEVSVDSDGTNSISVTVEVIGYPSECPNKAAYSWVADRVMSRKFDEYSELKFSQERLRLDQFAWELNNKRGSRGYIIVYDAVDARKPLAQERGARAKNYLVKERSLDAAQIVVINGGRRVKTCIELFIAPAGALPPTATPPSSPKK